MMWKMKMNACEISSEYALPDVCPESVIIKRCQPLAPRKRRMDARPNSGITTRKGTLNYSHGEKMAESPPESQ